ncbi:MAG: hypothetical protein WAM14_09600 [Candidatus Nitrosopolaris sp.]
MSGRKSMLVMKAELEVFVDEDSLFLEELFAIFIYYYKVYYNMAYAKIQKIIQGKKV